MRLFIASCVSLTVGPVPVGINSFDFTASAPQPHLLPSTSSDEILGVTVLILTGSYRDKEFVRVGYYVNTEYEDEERKLNPPETVEWEGLIRNVLVEKPRVTRFNNPWDQEEKRVKGWSNSSSGDVTGINSNQDQQQPSFIAKSSQAPGQGPFASPLPPPIVPQSGLSAVRNGNGNGTGDVEMA